MNSGKNSTSKDNENQFMRHMSDKISAVTMMKKTIKESNECNKKQKLPILNNNNSNQNLNEFNSQKLHQQTSYMSRHNVASIIKPNEQQQQQQHHHDQINASVNSSSSPSPTTISPSSLNKSMPPSHHPAASLYNQYGNLINRSHQFGSENYLVEQYINSKQSVAFNLMNNQKVALDAAVTAAVAGHHHNHPPHHHHHHNPFLSKPLTQPSSSSDFQDLAMQLNSNFAAAAAMQASLLSQNPTFNVFNRAVQNRMAAAPSFDAPSATTEQNIYFNPYFAFNATQANGQRLASELFIAASSPAKCFNSSLQLTDPNDSHGNLSNLSSNSSTPSSSSSSSYSSKFDSLNKSPTSSHQIQAAISPPATADAPCMNNDHDREPL